MSGPLLPPGYEPPAGDFDRWREVGPGVLVRRSRFLDLDLTLVLGDERALLVDTHVHASAASELVAQVRTVTTLPWVALNTHAHAAHAFGNATLAAAQPDLEIWGHERCRAELAQSGDLHRRVGVQQLLDAGRATDAEAVADVVIRPPDRTLTAEATLDLGGRTVTLHHPGPGHTDHDVVAHVPDADVSVVGDLVAQGAPPSFADAHPLHWSASLTALLPRLGGTVVPGHGDVVDPDFVASRRDDLEQLATTVRDLAPDVDDRTVVLAAARLRIGRRAGLDALRRALAQRA